MSFYNHKGRKIYYVVDGDLRSNKPIIVILNGIMMSTVSWNIFVESFTENNTLIRFDMYDQGQSEKLNDNYTQEIQVELLKDILVYLGIEKVNVVGISYGASIALQFVSKYPKKVGKLVVANVVAYTSPWLKAIGDGWNEVALSRNPLAYYNISIPYIYSPQFYIENIKWMDERKNILLPIFRDEVFLEAMIRLTKSAETHDVRKDLKDIMNKTLIIASTHDYLTPVFEQEYIKEKITDSELVVIPNCGHASMYEKPKLFTSLILGFINSNQEKTVI